MSQAAMLIVGTPSAALDALTEATAGFAMERWRVRTGSRALLAVQRQPMVIVTESRLPDMASSELLEFLSAGRASLTQPVCVVEQLGNRALRVSLVSPAGVVERLPEPISAATLRLALERLYCGARGSTTSRTTPTLDAWRWFEPAAA